MIHSFQMCLEFHTHVKQVLATRAWNSNIQNNSENICQCVQGNKSDPGQKMFSQPVQNSSRKEKKKTENKKGYCKAFFALHTNAKTLKTDNRNNNNKFYSTLLLINHRYNNISHMQ